MIENTGLTKCTYHFKSSCRNPAWSIKNLVPLRSCLIHNNSSKIIYGDLISRTPKTLVVLEVEKENSDTGEIECSECYTNDFKASRNRKIKAVNKFCDYYEPLYQSRKVSLLFHTFTRMDYSSKDMSTMLECVKMRYRALKRELRGYLWVLEISESDHVHYHLIIAIDRVVWNKMPGQLKFEDLWGQRTGVEFIKKSVRAYLTKYLYKSDAKLLRRRSYAISQKLH